MPRWPQKTHPVGPRPARSLAARAAALAAALLIAACGGGGSSGGGGGGGDDPGPATPGLLSGKVSYDAVPATPTAGLDYANTRALPVRGAVVEAFDDSGVLARSTTAADGSYTLPVAAGRTVRVRVQSLLQHGAGAWNVAVRDNTSPAYRVDPAAAPVYALTSQPLAMPERGAVLDLHAPSGWRQGRYGAVRAAAPFSVLDQAYAAMQRFLAEDPTLVFPPLDIYWSVDNRPAEGEEADGDIGTSHWDDEALYILGKADVDTDEYDTGVVVHEWGHYFEGRLSRSDSIGGDHGGGDQLDPRVAWGEGWGNALAGIVRADPSYIDTSGPRQSESMELRVDQLPEDPQDRSWYSENAIQQFVYRLAQLPGGFGATVATMRHEQRETPAFTSLFSFASGLGPRLPQATAAQASQLLMEIGTPPLGPLDAWGTGVDYLLPDPPQRLPLYQDVGEAPGQACVSNAYGEYNKLGQTRLLRLQAPQAGRYQLTVRPEAGVPPRHRASVAVYRQGVQLEEETPGSGVYVLEPGTLAAVLTDTPLDSLWAPPIVTTCWSLQWRRAS